MTTAARVYSTGSAHFYSRDGQPQYEIMGKTTGRMRPVTIADARKLGFLPSVTTVLKVLAARGLEAWKTEMACLTVLTAPRKAGEDLDAFVKRVLQDERQQDEEAAKARDLGTAIHAAIEEVLNGGIFDADLQAYVYPAVDAIRAAGLVVATEKIVVGEGYAGKLDCLTENEVLSVIDIKTTKRIPKKESWWDHLCQTAAYGKALGNSGDKRIQTANLYVSTETPGLVTLHVQQDWERPWKAFEAILKYWQLANDYQP